MSPPLFGFTTRAMRDHAVAGELPSVPADPNGEQRIPEEAPLLFEAPMFFFTTESI